MDLPSGYYDFYFLLECALKKFRSDLKTFYDQPINGDPLTR